MKRVVYQRRIVDDVLDAVFVPGGLSAVALEGAKGVGKTATGTQRASTVLTSLQVLTTRALIATIGAPSCHQPPSRDHALAPHRPIVPTDLPL